MLKLETIFSNCIHAEICELALGQAGLSQLPNTISVWQLVAVGGSWALSPAELWVTNTISLGSSSIGTRCTNMVSCTSWDRPARAWVSWASQAGYGHTRKRALSRYCAATGLCCGHEHNEREHTQGERCLYSQFLLSPDLCLTSICSRHRTI
jgi:hypothetical protein